MFQRDMLHKHFLLRPFAVLLIFEICIFYCAMLLKHTGALDGGDDDDDDDDDDDE